MKFNELVTNANRKKTAILVKEYYKELVKPLPPIECTEHRFLNFKKEWEFFDDEKRFNSFNTLSVTQSFGRYWLTSVRYSALHRVQTTLPQGQYVLVNNFLYKLNNDDCFTLFPLVSKQVLQGKLKDFPVIKNDLQEYYSVNGTKINLHHVFDANWFIFTNAQFTAVLSETTVIGDDKYSMLQPLF